MSILNKIKENKELLLMIFGTACEVGAVALALRNGSRAKKKLNDMPEDASAIDKMVEIAPDILPVVGLLVIGEGAQWWARSINIRDIVSLSSAAVVASQRAKNKDEAFKETVDKDVYEKAKTKEAKKNYDSAVKQNDNQIMYAETGMNSAYLFHDSITGYDIQATPDWIEAQFAKFQRDFCNEYKMPYTGREDDWIPYWCLGEGYFMEMNAKDYNSHHGWRRKDIVDLEIRLSTDRDPFDNPDRKATFMVGFNHDPEIMPSDRW